MRTMKEDKITVASEPSYLKHALCVTPLFCGLICLEASNGYNSYCRLVLGKNMSISNGCVCLGLNLASKCVCMCMCVGGGCLYVFCKEAKVMPFSACHQPGTRQFSAQSLLSATLNFIIKSLLSREGENCLIIQNTFHM